MTTMVASEPPPALVRNPWLGHDRPEPILLAQAVRTAAPAFQADTWPFWQQHLEKRAIFQ